MSKKKIPTIRSLAFIEARERLGLSTEVLALSACLSKKQIEQIENGEQSAFYSAALKLRSAQKVATILGLEEADYLEVEIEAPNQQVQLRKVTHEHADGLDVRAQHRAGVKRLAESLHERHQLPPIQLSIAATAADFVVLVSEMLCSAHSAWRSLAVN